MKRYFQVFQDLSILFGKSVHVLVFGFCLFISLAKRLRMGTMEANDDEDDDVVSKIFFVQAPIHSSNLLGAVCYLEAG